MVVGATAKERRSDTLDPTSVTGRMLLLRANAAT
jgi:hypothetical protein